MTPADGESDDLRGGLPAALSRGEPEPLFEAVIAPHQSLSRRGMAVLASTVGGFSLLISLRFLLLGAWPVMAFSGVEVALALVLLSVHRRQASRREIIRLDQTAITVVRTDP